VETHATPVGLGPDGAPRTAVVEAVVASSPRPGSRWPGRWRRWSARRWRGRRVDCGAMTSPTPSAATGCAPRGTGADRPTAAGPQRRPPGAAPGCGRGGHGAQRLAGHSPPPQQRVRGQEPVVAARSISATGRSTRTKSPASTRCSSGVVTSGRSAKPPGGNSGQSARSSPRRSITVAAAVSGYTRCSWVSSRSCAWLSDSSPGTA